WSRQCGTWASRSMMPWRSPSRLRSEPGVAARQAPFAGGRLLTVMMLRGYFRPSRVIRRSNLSGRLRLFATTRSGRDERRLWIRNRYTLHVGEQLKMVCCVHHLCAALIRAALELWLGLLESLV